MIKVNILAVGVHPDDVELSCAGTLLHHAALGHTFGLLDLTRGELGTRGTPEIRMREADASARKLGARFRENLGLADGFITHDEPTLRKVMTAIRDCRPDIVLANALSDRHPDHGRTANLVADAAYYSGLRKIETVSLQGKPQEPWRPRAVYHYIQDRNRHPDFVVDVTPYFERKMEAIACFESQFSDSVANAYSSEPTTPISGDDFMEFIRAKARNLGREAGYELAEGFNFARYPGVRDLFDLD